MLALVAKFQPYKCKRSNTVDIVLLLVTLSSIITMTVMYPRDRLMFPKQFLIALTAITFFIPHGCVFCLVFGQSLAKGWQYYKTFLLKSLNRFARLADPA